MPAAIRIHMRYTRAVQSNTRDVVAGDAKTGSKLRENVRRQAFGHDVGELLTRGDVKNTKLAEGDALADEEDVELHVLGPSMMHGVGR